MKDLFSAFYNSRNLFCKRVTFATPYFYFCWIIKFYWFKTIYNFCHVLYSEYKILQEYELMLLLNISPSCINQLNIKPSDWTENSQFCKIYFFILKILLYHVKYSTNYLHINRRSVDVVIWIRRKSLFYTRQLNMNCQIGPIIPRHSVLQD